MSNGNYVDEEGHGVEVTSLKSPHIRASRWDDISKRFRELRHRKLLREKAERIAKRLLRKCQKNPNVTQFVTVITDDPRDLIPCKRKVVEIAKSDYGIVAKIETGSKQVSGYLKSLDAVDSNEDQSIKKDKNVLGTFCGKSSRRRRLSIF